MHNSWWGVFLRVFAESFKLDFALLNLHLAGNLPKTTFIFLWEFRMHKSNFVQQQQRQQLAEATQRRNYFFSITSHASKH